MNELIYNQWHFARPDLAATYLNVLTKGAGDPIALQCPRRWGKTTFLLNEMSEAAVDAGFLCVYIDVWQNRSDVLGAINYGLQEAIDDLDVPKSVVGKRLKTVINKVSAGPIAVDFGEEPARRRPDSPYLLVDWLLKTLVRRAGRPVLLLFDEIQEVAVSSDGENIVSALRAAITKSKRSVRVVFTGSNQERLHALFAKSRAALYEGASVLPFPRLGDDFLSFVSQQAVRIFRRRIPEEDLRDAFERFQYQPRSLVDLVFLFASGTSTSLADILSERLDETLSAEIAQPQFDSLTPLQRQIAERLASGGDVSSINARRSYAKALRRKTVSPGSINNALRALIQKHIISKPVGSHGGYTFDDPSFREWLRLSAGAPTRNLPLISRVLRFQEPLAEDVMRDALTGAYNRRYFNRAFTALFEDTESSSLPMTLIVVDVDALKRSNDTHGHLSGDNILKTVAARIRPLLRPNDVLSRYGGDEFAVILVDTPVPQGVGVAEKICADIAALPVHLPEGDMFVTVSCGVVTYSGEAKGSADAILANADAALYEAKKRGRNRAVLFSQDLDHAR
jgi:diguanylate cyclase (GGDEF)-like protein